MAWAFHEDIGGQYYNGYQLRMWAGVNAYVSSQNDTQAWITVECAAGSYASSTGKAAEGYGVVTQAGHAASGRDAEWNEVGWGNLYYDSWVAQGSATYGPFPKGTSGYNVYCWCKTWGTEVNGHSAWGGYQGEAGQNVWIPALASYTVYYDANGGTGAPAAQTKWCGQTLTLSSVVPTKEGYTFGGWATSPTGGAAYWAGSPYTNNSGVTLYAIWTVDIFYYDVNYDANGGYNAPFKDVKTSKADIRLASEIPIRDKCIFCNWNTKPDGTGIAYNPNDMYRDNKEIKLYAIWKPVPVKNIDAYLDGDVLHAKIEDSCPLASYIEWHISDDFLDMDKVIRTSRNLHLSTSVDSSWNDVYVSARFIESRGLYGDVGETAKAMTRNSRMFRMNIPNNELVYPKSGIFPSASTLPVEQDIPNCLKIKDLTIDGGYKFIFELDMLYSDDDVYPTSSIYPE